MSTYKTIILYDRKEIEDRAINGYFIPIERLRSMAAPNRVGLYNGYRDNPFAPDLRSVTEKIRDHQEYDYALVVTEYVDGRAVQYAIYKGERNECHKEVNRFEESKRNLAGYTQNGNGKRRNVQ